MKSITPRADAVMESAANIAADMRHEFLMPEHLLSALVTSKPFTYLMAICSVDVETMLKKLADFLRQTEQVPGNMEYELTPSYQFAAMMSEAFAHADNAGRKQVDVQQIVVSMMHLGESMAATLIRESIGVGEEEFLYHLVNIYEAAEKTSQNDISEEDDFEDTGDDPFAIFDNVETTSWQSLVTCISDSPFDHNPLIGRDFEMERTIQVLCRKDKNNPLHVGEPGVGKTALVYGLAQRIATGNVPERLRESKIYLLDLGQMIAGTQFRGEFEKRLKMVMEGVSEEKNPIVYIDEIHNLIGAGQGSEGSLDASNLLKPYLEAGEIRFIGSTTYQEYNRYMAKSRGIVRRFQQIDIAEPSAKETVDILLGLKSRYEDYHRVTIPDEIITYAVDMAAKHITDRFLPDKAIDLIDEASAWLEIHPLASRNGKRKPRKQQVLSRELINNILSRICKIDERALNAADNKHLENLRPQILSQVYGQDTAVENVVSAVEMSRAGLMGTDKPISSLLFVGPTGVGKTELARVLAAELGIELVRFDMSEYTEKHAVAKLIGSPAGYVGYEDGGLLTDAIRRSPNCVLLLDEIEKAHSDIYNILLQVMDYARLTDNRGQKAYFQGVILIMTSNAGAQFASQANVGFTGQTTKGQAMMQQLKRTFKPEFIARLSNIVVFNDLDLPMAERILDKKLELLNTRLAAKNVRMTLAADARELLLKKGYTQQNGARQMEHVLQQHLNPLLTREILYGTLREGGEIEVTREMMEGAAVRI